MAFLVKSIFTKCTIKRGFHQSILPSAVVFTSHPKYRNTKTSSSTSQARPHLYDHGDKRQARQPASRYQNVPPQLHHKTKMS